MDSCSCGQPRLRCCCRPPHGRPPHYRPSHHHRPHHRPPPPGPVIPPPNDWECPAHNCPHHPPNQCPRPPFRPPELPYLPPGNDWSCPPNNPLPVRPPERPYLPPGDCGCNPHQCPHRPSCGDSGGYYWVDSSVSNLPHSAFRGGHDIDSEPIYVGRSSYEGDWLPAKVIPGRNCAYVSYNGKEIAVHSIQVLTDHPRFRWVSCRGRNIPPGAIEGGRTNTGEVLYIGRVHHRNSLTVGKVHPSHGTCYIAFDGREIGYPDYEILTL